MLLRMAQISLRVKIKISRSGGESHNLNRHEAASRVGFRAFSIAEALVMGRILSIVIYWFSN